MTKLPRNFLQKFRDRQANTAKLEGGGDSSHLYIERPLDLAALFAYCNGLGTDTRTFLRGCTKNYATAYPALFRGVSEDGNLCERKRRWFAYKYLHESLRKLKGNRWRRNDLGAVLQHYGIKTPWLDVVANLYTAVWFATHELSDNGSFIVPRPTKSDYCWISFYRRKLGTENHQLQVKNLSAAHSSTHVRPHTQHGVSLAMQPDNNEHPHHIQDFNRYRIAHVRFPNSKKWQVSGHMFSTSFMFPSRDDDGSLRRLSSPGVKTILDDACRKFHLQPGTLGMISSHC